MKRPVVLVGGPKRELNETRMAKSSWKHTLGRKGEGEEPKKKRGGVRKKEGKNTLSDPTS